MVRGHGFLLRLSVSPHHLVTGAGERLLCNLLRGLQLVLRQFWVILLNNSTGASFEILIPTLWIPGCGGHSASSSRSFNSFLQLVGVAFYQVDASWSGATFALSADSRLTAKWLVSYTVLVLDLSKTSDSITILSRGSVESCIWQQHIECWGF